MLAKEEGFISERHVCINSPKKINKPQSRLFLFSLFCQTPVSKVADGKSEGRQAGYNPLTRLRQWMQTSEQQASINRNPTTRAATGATDLSSALLALA